MAENASSKQPLNVTKKKTEIKPNYSSKKDHRSHPACRGLILLTAAAALQEELDKTVIE
jgi:hypothetical protein